MSAAELRAAVPGVWVERPDGFWLRLPAGELRGAAQVMRGGGGRFAALVIRPAAAGLRLSWHWDVGGTLLSVDAVLAAGERAPSIVDLYPGADWGEREGREYYGVEFEGRETTAPLMLREGDTPGVLLRRAEGRP